MRSWMLLGALISCDTPDKADGPGASEDVPPPLSEEALAVVSPTRMKAAVDFLADDALGGRITGSPGHAAAMAWLLDEMADIGLEPAGLEGDFVYPYPATPPDGWYQLDADGGISLSQPEVGYDLVGRLPGADPALAKEHILVMAHYDHLGVSVDGEIYNGAFDNASGVAVVLELARVLSANPPDRSVIFLITDEEETGLEGARAWLEDPTIDAAHIRFGLSVDPVGRPSLPDYWPTVLIGTERSPEMDALWREAAAWNAQPTIFIHRDLIPVFSSDQDRLYELDPPIPGFWFVNPGMSFYHTPDDTPETIDYRSVKDHLAAIAQGTAAFADADETCTDLGPQELSREDMVSALAGMEALEATGELTIEEQSALRTIRNPIEDAANGGEVGVEARTAYLDLMLLLVTQIAPDHPGAVPPPFPEE